MKWAAAKAIIATIFFLTTAHAPAQNGTNALILYDSAGPYGWIGGLHAKMLANLLGHFQFSYQIAPVENYHAGDLNAYRAVFYLGTVFANPLPSAFRADVLNA